MNDRIKEFARQVDACYIPRYDMWQMDTESLKKFAELIVQECAMFVVIELEGQVGSRIADATANRLEEHFGVKE